MHGIIMTLCTVGSLVVMTALYEIDTNKPNPKRKQHEKTPRIKEGTAGPSV
jgi:hypothetical protein